MKKNNEKAKKQQSLGAAYTREFQFKQKNNNCNFTSINNCVDYNICNRNIKQKAKKHNSRSTKNELKLTKQ